jgi:hypothetical protein
VLEAKRRFESIGLATFTEDDVSCCYAVQDKVWIEDPDGNAWEVFVVKGDADVMQSRPVESSDTCASSCCCAPADVTHAAR